ncbi:serine/threonine-protein kinase [Nannocystis sp. SCPEA4]|uniref:serine/threonine-protein kinase n=1 Tax=Nannocystis sp. SCPEA4 TaxID=2996787 RepID=UPI002270337C|nr:serine/threonine-protein kinase [Nannocystis sp. SCPEA4]MCY1057714.1 serine/threonine-protein kinase [Nannocystis sp. SCPEA4]
MAERVTLAGGGCLAEHTLDALSRGRLSASEQAAAALHLDVCDECRRLLAALARVVDSAEAGTCETPELGERRVVSGAQQRLAAGSRVGRYTVLHVVGAGAMGTVYAAYDPELDRRVALKLVHHGLLSDATRETAAARLLREAQALARLSHPNVITVFDAGRFEGQVFLAMEFVEGGTLRQWLAAERRSPAAIVERFVAAGRALAALHGAGLVHRDFKPENVLVSADGRVQVSDFGLARVTPTASAAIERPFDPARPLPGGSEAVTRTGALLGTPAYMAPELWQGAPADARSDQFAFCVALYEALQGARPFTAAALAGEVGAAGLVAAPDDRLPAGMRRPLAIGLARAPEDRHASMHALLVELERGLAGARRRRPLVIVAAAIVAVGLGAWGWQHERGRDHDRREAACKAAGARIDEVWGEAARAEMERSFLATGKPFAATTFARTTPWLDRWAAAWREAATTACRAHTVDAVWDAELRVRAEDCLDEARAGFAALVDELRDADVVALTQATDAAAELAPVDACIEPAALRERPLLPQARRGESRAIRRRLARARSLQAVGDYAAALPVAHEAVGAARASGWPALVAEAEFRAASLQEKRGDYPAAEAGLLRALTAAESARARGLALAITTDLVYVVGYAAARHAEGRVWAHAARTLLALLPGASPLEQAHLDSRLAAVVDVVGAYDEAAGLHSRALAVREAALGPSHPDVVRSLVGLAAARQALGELDAAAGLYERALAVQERLFGAEHPDVALILHNLAGVRYGAGALDEAVPLYERALAIQERALGPDHPGVAETLHDLAVTHRARGASAESLRLQTRALALYERALGPDHPRVASSLNSMALLVDAPDEAQRLLVRALAISEKALGPGHREVGDVLYNLASLRREAGATAEAIELFRRSLAIYAAALGPQHPDVREIEAELARMDAP